MSIILTYQQTHKKNEEAMEITYSGGVKNRRKRVIERLEAQLKSGTKTSKNPEGGIESVPLSEKDVSRIEKELTILKNK